jgi:hypothetical protein
MLQPTVMRRLSFIKYLYETGIDQSRRPEPMNAVSLLTFHDSIELFLRLATEYKDIASKTDLKFLEYWDVLKHKIPNGLTQKESVRSLDSARGNLKHQGARPAKEDIDDYRATTKRFFEENTPLIFNVEFSDISMISIVQPVIARKTLEEAEVLIENNDIKEALMKLRIAFDQIIGNYKEKTGFGIEHQWRLGSLHQQKYNVLYETSVKDEKVRYLFSEVIKDMDIVKQQLMALQSATNVVTLGLDYQHYAKFKELTAHIYKNIQGEYKENTMYPRKVSLTIEDCQFCLNFVMEGAIRIQRLGLVTE